MDKKIFRDLSYGMYVISAKDSGCIINTLTQITSENPVISISLNKNNYTNTIIKDTKKFTASIISEKTNPNVISVFGFQSSKDNDKYKEFKYNEINDIKVLEEETTGYIECEVVDIVDCGTHDIFIAKVVDAVKTNDNVPMTYKYYHEVIKGKAPKNAPTYVEEETNSNQKEETEEEVYVCDICGYRYVGHIPDDFVCPICGANRSHFKRVK